jgi:broad specificity phosphatase PhoE
MLPRNLVYVRHGQSQRNLAGKQAYEHGDMALFEEIINRPSSLALLTPEGEDQARATGAWLREQNFNFGRYYTSSYLRAKQTAGLLNLPGSHWFIENNLRERSGGIMEDMTKGEREEYLNGLRNKAHLLDLFNFQPTRGESYADVTVRWRFFLDTLHRECGNMDVLVVNHGDNMWVARSLHERWTPEEFVKNRGRYDTHGGIPNCMVLHYSRVNPETGEVLQYLGWYRTCCPWKDSTPSSWQKIIRKRYTSQELLSQVEEAAARVQPLRAAS